VTPLPPEEHDAEDGPPRRVNVLAAVVVALAVLILLVLHLTGVMGPAAH
jgi:hypothetical protein